MSGNHGNSKRQEKAAIKKALNSGRFLLPMHDQPARIEGGRVVARLTGNVVPGPEILVEVGAGPGIEGARSSSE